MKQPEAKLREGALTGKETGPQGWSPLRAFLLQWERQVHSLNWRVEWGGFSVKPKPHPPQWPLPAQCCAGELCGGRKRGDPQPCLPSSPPSPTPGAAHLPHSCRRDLEQA